MAVPPWLLDWDWRPYSPSKCHNYSWHGICYSAEDQTLKYVHLITFLLQHMQTHPLEDNQSMFLLPCYMKIKVMSQKTNFLCYYETFMTKINYFRSRTDHQPHSGCTIHSSFIILTSCHPQLITGWKQHSKSNILWSLIYILPYEKHNLHEICALLGHYTA